MNFTLTNQNKIFNENKINVQNILDSAVLHYQKGEFSAAQLLFKKTLKLDPNNELALMLLGLLAAQNKEYQLSITLLSKSISINPNYVDALYNRGNVLQNIDCFEEALDDYNKVSEIGKEAAKVATQVKIKVGDEVEWEQSPVGEAQGLPARGKVVGVQGTILKIRSSDGSETTIDSDVVKQIQPSKVIGDLTGA